MSFWRIGWVRAASRRTINDQHWASSPYEDMLCIKVCVSTAPDWPVLGDGQSRDWQRASLTQTHACTNMYLNTSEGHNMHALTLEFKYTLCNFSNPSLSAVHHIVSSTVSCTFLLAVAVCCSLLQTTLPCYASCVYLCRCLALICTSFPMQGYAFLVVWIVLFCDLAFISRKALSSMLY